MTKVELTDLQLLLLRQVIKQAAKDLRYDHALTGLPEDLRKAQVLENIDRMFQSEHSATPALPLEEQEQAETNTKKAVFGRLTAMTSRKAYSNARLC